MKNQFKIVILALLTIVCSCSNDDDGPSGSAPDIATLTIDDADYNINTTDIAYCDFDGEQFHVSINDLEFSFNKFGNFGTAEVHKYINGYNLYYRPPFFNSSSSVNFVLESIDTVNKRVKGHVSGTVFNTNPTAIDQDMPFACEFDFKYYYKIPLLQGIYHSANINGEEWKFSNEQIVPDVNYTFTHTFVSDDVNSILFTFNLFEMVEGQHSFTPETSNNKLQYAKYSQATQENIVYNTSGTLNVIKREDVIFPWVFVLICTYDLTAVNPDNPADVVHVNNGEFKMMHHWE